MNDYNARGASIFAGDSLVGCSDLLGGVLFNNLPILFAR
jgi:hypothetical protein